MKRVPLHSQESIAIVGLSCRYPQAANLEEFWNILASGKNIIGDVPSDRWDMNEYFHEDKNLPGKTNQKQGGFLDHIHDFDPALFNISPKEAIEMSPSQKLIMELAWEAAENSSIPYKDIAGSRSGVFIGNIWSDFEHLRKKRNAEINNFSGIGFSANVIANRISYFMGLTGPSLVLDTGCSSSLVALMLAVESLQSGSSDMCLTGGINHMLDPEIYVYLSKFGGLSNAGRSKSFDAEADGFVRAEGAGLVLLKRHSDAVRDGDKIWAVIQGGAINNNGFNENMPATSISGQKEVLAQAYDHAQLDPAGIHFVEAHGTGTKLGDPVEANAIGEFFSAHKKETDKLYLGSAKANFGHTEAAAGITGLLKVILAMNKGIIPKNPFFETPNPNIRFDQYGLQVPQENIPWPVTGDKTMKAGVSSFGWGGSNVHVVLEQYNAEQTDTHHEPDFNHEHFVLPLSAKSQDALKDYVKAYAQWFENELNGSVTQLLNICAATALRKPGLDYRIALTGKNKQELLENMHAMIEPGMLETDPVQENNFTGTVFVFPGQGSQWIGMGKQLYATEKNYKETIDACDKAFKKYVDWSLSEELHASEETSKLNRIDVIQPCLFAAQVALAKLWISRGVEPDAVVGHSMGEVSAAYIAGALSLDDAACVICSRSLLMNTLSGGGGAMAVTELTFEEAEKTIAPYNGKLSVAVHNSPKSTVIAGDQEAISDVLQNLEENNLFGRQVKVDVASHSPQMDAIKEKLGKRLQHIEPRPSTVALYSTSANKYIEGEQLDAGFWMNNLRSTVQFFSVIEKLLADDHRLFIEMSPHPVLKTALSECVQACNADDAVVLNSVHREEPEHETLIKNFTAIFESGYDVINWKKYFGVSVLPYVQLPAYPYQRENYEVKDRSALAGSHASAQVHPLLGEKVSLAGSDNIHYWQNTLSLYNLPFLTGHKVNDQVVFPASGFIEMILAAVEEMDLQANQSIQNLVFDQAVVLQDDAPIKIQLRFEIMKDNRIEFRFHIYQEDNWVTCCHGHLDAIHAVPTVHSSIDGDDMENMAWKSIEPAQFYKSFADFGVEYGETFQNVDTLYLNRNTVQTNIKMQSGSSLTGPYQSNLLFLDNCIHPLFAQVFTMDYEDTVKTTFVSGTDQVLIYDKIDTSSTYRVYAQLNEYTVEKAKNTTRIKGDIQVYNANNDLIMAWLGVEAGIVDSLMPREKTGSQKGEGILAMIRSEKETNQSLSLVENYLIKIIAKATKAHASKINTKTTFKKLGVDSLTMVQIRNILEKDFETQLPVSTFSQNPCINDYASFLVNTAEERHLQVEDIDHNPWFIEHPAKGEAAHQLFLFHDAGGNSNLFEGWRAHIHENTELICIELPGRGNRVDEQPYSNFWPLMRKLVPQIKMRINKPFSFYGHSMGGLIAFEASRYLRARYDITPDQLIISGTPCLRDYVNHFVNQIFEQQMSDQELLSFIPVLQHLDAESHIARELLKTLRADFSVIHTHNYFDDARLDFPITAIHARNDDRVKLEDVERWHIETNGAFNIIHTDGEHDFVYHRQEHLTGLINELLINTPEYRDRQMVRTD